MDTDRFVRLRGALAAAPSRRAVHRALAGLAAGSVLAPLIDLVSVTAKKKKKKLSKKKFCKKAHGGPVCKKSNSGCCYKGDVCTNTPCGCMETGRTNCCVTNEPRPDGSRGYPCPDDHTCCPSKGYDYFPCCPPGETCCGDSCCPLEQCCGGDTCCHRVQTCCPDGSCHIDELHCP
jgi:hypothetical protein